MIDFQLLAYKVEVSVEDERLDAVLAYLANSADQPLVPRAVMRYAVVGGGPYAIYEEGDYLAAVEHPDDVLYVIYARCHARLLDYLSLGQWVALHAGVVSIGDRRALVIGARGTGKTTLMLRLLFDRYAVEGDELVFTRAGKAVSLPRNFHVKPGAVKLLPELADGRVSLPMTSTSDGVIITAFNPVAQGFSWNLQCRPIDVAFVLRANHGGMASCRAISSVDIVAAAVANSLPMTATSREAVRACSALLGEAEGHELTVGAVSATADLLAARVAG